MKFYQLIASLFMILPKLNLSKLKLEYLKLGFKCKKKKDKDSTKTFASLEFDFFRVQLKFAFRIGRYFHTVPQNLVSWT